MRNLSLCVGNSWTQITEADRTIISALDTELRYPTPFAQDSNSNWTPPPGEGVWDGWIRLLRQPRTAPSAFPSGLLARACRVANKLRYQIRVDDQRVRPELGVPEFPALSLRDYQRAAVEAALRVGRGVLDLPPRAGKTRMAAELQRRLALPTVWLAPTDRIVTQTVDVLTGFFGENYAAKPQSAQHADKIGNVPVVVMTAAMAARVPEAWYCSRQVVIVDEFHRSAAKTYTHEIFPKLAHVFYRYGMTGTFFRSGDDAMAMHGLLSETIFRLSPGDLLHRGHLVPTHVVFFPVRSPKIRGAGRTFHGGFGEAGIHGHETRNQMAANAALTLFQGGRVVLVLVGTKNQGEAILRLLEPCLPNPPSGAEFRTVEFVSTSRARPVQARILDSFLNRQEVKILIGTSLLAEGVDMPVCDALVYAKGEKAEVSLTQAVYRVGTAISGKKSAIVVDFGDRHHRHLLKHSIERLRSYYREPTFSVSVLSDICQLGAWSHSIL